MRRPFIARIGLALVAALSFTIAGHGGNAAVAAPEESYRIQVGSHAFSTAYDPTTRTLYVGADGAISVFKDGVLTGKIPVGEASMAADPVTHTVYAVDSSNTTVLVIKGTTVTATIPMPDQPQALAVDPGTGKVYVATSMAGVTVIQGTKSPRRSP